MSEVQFNAPPAALANIFHNIISMHKEKAGEAGQPLIYLRYQWDEETSQGQIMAVGYGRYTAGLDWMPVEGGTKDGYAEVRVLGINPEKTTIVDDLKKLAQGIRGTTTSKQQRVFVTMKDKHSISVTYGPELVGELADADPFDQTAGKYEKVEDLVDEMASLPAPAGPMAFKVGILAKLKEIKVTGGSPDMEVVDIAKHPDHDLIGLAVGPTFRGLVGALGRQGYAAGGPWGDGPGRPEHLWKG